MSFHMKRELGISVYPDHSDPEKDKAYIKKAADLGFTRLFMSMLEVQDGKEATAAKFKNIISFARDHGFEVILDINPGIFKQLGISYDDLKFFADLGASGIRLDEGFDGLKESLISYNPYGLNIELNMSNNVAYLDNILSYEANVPYIYGCHNFIRKKAADCRMISSLSAVNGLKNTESRHRHCYKSRCFDSRRSVERKRWVADP